MPRLETHKLKGKLSGSWACSAGYDLRIVFDFVESEKQKEDDIFLLEIGTHEEVY
ncbi:MAG TPA: plasmid stabilization protein [Proteobacteria bacterium]|nr:plasmid stabilization protein [Pseudomonadota bacterium]